MPSTPSSPSEASAAVPATPSGKWRQGWQIVPLLLAVAALLAVAWLWQRLDRVQEELARRTTDTQAEVASTRALAAQAESLTQDMQARLGVAEVRLSEVSLQRSQLEELMLSVSRTRDDSLVQDLESAVRLAQQQTQLTGSAQPLISALQAAQQRIERAAQPRLNPVLRAITRDVERIRAAALVDVPALASRLDDLVRHVDEMPLRNAMRSAEPPKTQPTARQAVLAKGESLAPDAGWWAQVQQWWHARSGQWWSSLQQGTLELVRVSRIDQPEAALLAPDQAFFLRENLKLTLLNARLGLLARQWDTARADVRNARRLLQRYFDDTATATRVADHALKQLHEDLSQEDLPRPEETLAALSVAAGGR